MTRALAVVLVLAAVASCGGGDGDDGIGDIFDSPRPDAPALDGPPVNPLIGVGAVELVDGGYQFVEGPQWRDGSNDLLFSDIPANTIYRLVPGAGDPTVFRSPSGNSNGLAQWTALIACEHGNRRVSLGDGANAATLADRYQGMRLNSPNDVVVGPNGNIYFTDPPFGIQDNQRELPFMGVFRLRDGQLTTIREGALDERPNGIALSPDGYTLYVGDAAHATIRVYQLDVSGVPTTERQFTATSATPDGMAVDVAGNLFVTTEDGIEVYAPDGSRWGVIDVPEQPANAAFGDPDHRTLYITARTSLYRVRLTNPGIP